jgi:hypothetical protein
MFNPIPVNKTQFVTFVFNEKRKIFLPLSVRRHPDVCSVTKGRCILITQGLTSQNDCGNIRTVEKRLKLAKEFRKGGALMIKEYVQFSVISRPGGFPAK